MFEFFQSDATETIIISSTAATATEGYYGGQITYSIPHLRTYVQQHQQTLEDPIKETQQLLLGPLFG